MEESPSTGRIGRRDVPRCPRNVLLLSTGTRVRPASIWCENPWQGRKSCLDRVPRRRAGCSVALSQEGVHPSLRAMAAAKVPSSKGVGADETQDRPRHAEGPKTGRIGGLLPVGLRYRPSRHCSTDAAWLSAGVELALPPQGGPIEFELANACAVRTP